MTSPWARDPSAQTTLLLVLSFRNFTEPSQSRMFAPPGWLLAMLNMPAAWRVPVGSAVRTVAQPGTVRTADPTQETNLPDEPLGYLRPSCTMARVLALPQATVAGPLPLAALGGTAPGRASDGGPAVRLP